MNSYRRDVPRDLYGVPVTPTRPATPAPAPCPAARRARSPWYRFYARIAALFHRC
ncbi:hypothetical protein [Brevibacterium litoralis]|uniref:hypothetical protein n=1 Tax=Brevibacterium litoralis TaxID=3138935 RepID=UPI0032EFB74F